MFHFVLDGVITYGLPLIGAELGSAHHGLGLLAWPWGVMGDLA